MLPSCGFSVAFWPLLILMYASHHVCQTEQFSCNHEEEIQKLSRNLDAVTADNAALVVENQELKERVENLTHELIVKEATWCETEEQLNLKVIGYETLFHV